MPWSLEALFGGPSLPVVRVANLLAVEAARLLRVVFPAADFPVVLRVADFLVEVPQAGFPVGAFLVVVRVLALAQDQVGRFREGLAAAGFPREPPIS